MTRRALALVICLAPSLVMADPTPADMKRAKELAAESAKAYKRGELEVSVALLRQAYALYPQPNLLYNLGRALEGLGDKQGAVDAYTQYLAEADKVDDRGAIERRIATLQADLAAQKPVETTPPPKPDPAPTLPRRESTVVTQPVQQDDGGPSKLPWIPIIGGAAVLAGGGVLAYLATDHEDQAKHALGGIEAQNLHDKAEREAKYANVMFIGGGVLLAAGIVWKLVAGGGSSSQQSSVRAVVGPKSLALEWSLP